ncbi:MAG: cobalamin B12-binding domain-containing protein [Nitrospirae bacterium]|nr:cobalamin B12-binding domain-containing protein [Nitrospirota bacterium]
MKVLLVSPNREHLPDPVFPLGLSYIASALRKHDHDVRIIDLCFSEDMDREIQTVISDFQPDAIGMSLRNIDDVCFPKQHSYLEEYRTTTSSLRRYSSAPIVLGGSGFTIMPEAFMQELGADFGIIGEGEKAFPELLEKITSLAPSLVRREAEIRGAAAGHVLPPLQGGIEGGIGRIISSRSRIKDLDRITPDRELFDSSSYYRLGGMLNIQTKRGCPFRCVYCTYPQIEGRTVRMRSPGSVADEIADVIEKTGSHHFFFVDSIFNYPVSHAKAICEEIIRRGLNIQWSCYANPAHMTVDLADAMVRAGCTAVEFGTDSLVDGMLRNMGKSFTFSKVRKASAICKKSGLKFCHFIFAGSQGDTDETIDLTLARLEEIEPDAAVIMAGIRIFPGTVLAAHAKQDLGIADIGLEPVFYHSRTLTDYDKVAEAVSKKKNWIMPGYEINFHPRLQKKLRKHGIKGSLWEGLSKR